MCIKYIAVCIGSGVVRRWRTMQFERNAKKIGLTPWRMTPWRSSNVFSRIINKEHILDE